MMLKLATGLNHAIQNNQLILCWQPQFDLHTGELAGAEALVRWQHPARGLMLPGEFIPIAEKTGLIVPLGEWVMRHACEQFAEWRRHGLPLARLAINMASRQLEDEEIVSTIVSILRETGLSTSALELELTETGKRVSQDALQKLRLLSELGISIALDDFGTGCSGLWAIRHLPLRRIKLAQIYVDGIGNNLTDEAIIQMVIKLAHALELRVMAEGVVSLAQKQFLILHGCDEVQGYYYGTPLKAGKFLALFSRK